MFQWGTWGEDSSLSGSAEADADPALAGTTWGAGPGAPGTFLQEELVGTGREAGGLSPESGVSPRLTLKGLSLSATDCLGPSCQDSSFCGQCETCCHVGTCGRVRCSAAAFLLLQGLPNCLVTSCHSLSQEVLPSVLDISLTSHSGVGGPACAWQPWSSGLQMWDVENQGDQALMSVP